MAFRSISARHWAHCCLAIALLLPLSGQAATPEAAAKPSDGRISGELKQWHKITIDFTGPETGEEADVNPFTDYRLDVSFEHQGTGTRYVVPGFYAADGDAANSGANEGNVWRVHFSPGKLGSWSYEVSFRAGPGVAMADSRDAGGSAGFFDDATGVFTVEETDKTGRDFRAHGRLQYVGGRYLRFAGSGHCFLKQGADSPENLLAYADFDGEFKSDGKADKRIKTYDAHVGDWRTGDPTWAGGKGKGLIGAINYLAGEGLNAFSFIPLNIAGDDKNVFPYLTYDERMRLDVSRLAQWEVVFEHADQLGMFLHFKTQEAENVNLLDGGEVGPERRLYYRELIARFAHHLALNWNLGEEVGLGHKVSTEKKQAWASYFAQNDPYHHLIVIHNGNDHFDLLGDASELTGFSLQTNKPDFRGVHNRVRQYLRKSAEAGKPWAVACDEPGDAQHAIRPDDDAGNSHTDGRMNALWGTLLAGGWGNEYYFGYKHAHSDLTLEDFRSRDRWWDYPRYALEFFSDNEIPFWEMENDNSVSSAENDYGFFKQGDTYVLYLKDGGTTDVNLEDTSGDFTVRWFDPRSGGDLQEGSVLAVAGGGRRNVGEPPSSPAKDWVVLVRRK
ncbi:MAG: DUF5060 domain-containing protein [Planctomycetota bacterium]